MLIISLKLIIFVINTVLIYFGLLLRSSFDNNYDTFIFVHIFIYMHVGLPVLVFTLVKASSNTRSTLPNIKLKFDGYLL